MNDETATLSFLKEQVHAMCLRKGWGVEGVQNPQQVAMAMTVVAPRISLRMASWAA